jgi:hypothetical protein
LTHARAHRYEHGSGLVQGVGNDEQEKLASDGDVHGNLDYAWPAYMVLC